MLRKLLKHDLKHIFKGMLPFYIFIIITSLLTLIFYPLVMEYNISICRTIWWTLFFATILLLISALINNIISLWTRFINNLYKDESYLTHTLPVTKNQIYISKILSGFITFLTTSIVILISISILFYQINDLKSFKELIDTISQITNNATFLSLILIFILVSIEILNIIQIGFTGILLGYKSNNNKGIKTLFYGTFCYFMQSSVLLLIVFIIGMFSTKVKSLFLENSIASLNEVKIFFLGFILLYTLTIIVFYIINTKIFNKGINVDWWIKMTY